MNTMERVELESGKTVECDCEWDYERNPFDKEPEHYHGEDDGWHLRSWDANDPDLSPDEAVEIDDQLARQGPTT